MQILGIRTASTCVRYAIVEWDGQTASLVNAVAENKLDFPADLQEISQKLSQAQQQMENQSQAAANAELDFENKINQQEKRILAGKPTFQFTIESFESIPHLIYRIRNIFSSLFNFSFLFILSYYFSNTSSIN